MKEEMLKYGYSEKVEEEAVELLLQSIQAKMGIIDITKDKKEGMVVGGWKDGKEEAMKVYG